MREFKTRLNTIIDRSHEVIALYLHDINHIKCISADEEAELARIIRKGGPEASLARERLIKANLRFVVTVANQYKTHGAELADLISEGNIGLIKAVEHFDETRGFKFITYAVWWIRQSIMEAVSRNSNMVHLPANQQKILRAFRQLQEDILQKEQRILTIDEFCEVSGYDYDRVKLAVESNINPMLMDDKMSEDSDTTFGDMMASDSVCDSALDKESLHVEILSLFNKLLTFRESFVLRHIYGIDCQIMSLDEISDRLTLSRERTRQIMLSSINKLRNSAQASHLVEYLAA